MRICWMIVVLLGAVTLSGCVVGPGGYSGMGGQYYGAPGASRPFSGFDYRHFRGQRGPRRDRFHGGMSR